MKNYWVYSFDGINRILAAEDIEAETDAEAMMRAKEVAGGFATKFGISTALWLRFGPSD